MKIALLLMFVIAAAGLFAFRASADPLPVGSPAPALVVKTQNGKELDLGEVFRQGVTLVYFYPKADTPGCTKQACNLRDSREELSKAGIRVIGVSADAVTDQKAFEEKFQLNFDLVADADSRVIQAFGVPQTMGRFASRQSFLIKDGKVVWHQPKANPVTQAQDAIAALAALPKS